MNNIKTWDIFCKVIDNFGDIGVCWRLACQLAQKRQSVRLWVDDSSALSWMACGEKITNIEVKAWTEDLNHFTTPGDIVIEGFGCELPVAYVKEWAKKHNRKIRMKNWINLEYFSAEPYVIRSHGLASPILAGPGKGLLKHFFYPGLSENTGGLLREHDFDLRQSKFQADQWLKRQGIDKSDALLVSLFCYEPHSLKQLLQQYAQQESSTLVLITAGRASEAFHCAVKSLNDQRQDWNELGKLRWHQLPYLSQVDYDHLLWSCDLNFVRGEDSLARAILSGRPFIWNIYRQDDDAHLIKLQAFLDIVQPPNDLQIFHRVWNEAHGSEGFSLPCLTLSDHQAWAQSLREKVHKQEDLLSQLLEFVFKTH